jgi:two-component system response regulator VicR
MKILIVEDDELELKVIKHKLEAEGYTIITANDGMMAFEIIKDHDVDLIISDIMMPNMTGLEMLSLLKRFYYSKVPVIFISSLDQENIIIKSLGLGVEDYIVKPINFHELLTKVKKYIKSDSHIS